MSDILISTKDQVGEYDAIESAKPGEPLFPIQGGDPLGPPTVQFWADQARDAARQIMDGRRAGFEPSGERDEYHPTEIDRRDADLLLRKATNAEQISWAMKAYQRGDVEPEGDGRAVYNEDAGPVLTADALDLAARRKALIKMAEQLYNALGIARGVGEGLDKLGLHPEIASEIGGAVGLLKMAAEIIEPRRGRERS